VVKKPSGGRLLLPTSTEVNPKCYVCSSPFVQIKINTATTTLETFVDKVLKQKLGFNEPSVVVQSE
jgi:hypothetical protein